MKKKSNMYKLSVKQWNPYAGCMYDCIYCESTFKAQSKRQRKRCQKCYDYIPHEHPERLNRSLSNTKYMQFIFTCANGDISFCRTEYLKLILKRIKKEFNKIFLIQSKNPKTFNRVKFPKNAILGTTIETNDDVLYDGISKAPKPSQRYHDFLEVEHSLKMVTIEPVIDFDLNIMVEWIRHINPCMVWLGYDSKNNHLPEPKLEKVKNLYWELGERGFTVILKTIRKAWNED